MHSNDLVLIYLSLSPLSVYLEKLSCMNGNIVIVGDFHIDWWNTNGSERK